MQHSQSGPAIACSKPACSRQTDRPQVDENRQVAKKALGCQEEVTVQAARRKGKSRNAAVTVQAAGE
jgi:hypothetical protein